MTTSTHGEMPVGAMAVRPRFEAAETDGFVASHEFDLPASASLPVPHSQDACEGTIGAGLVQPRRCVWQRAAGGSGPLRCIWV